MDARSTRCVRRALRYVVLLASADATWAAPPGHPVSLRRAGAHRTENFLVRAPSAALAREIGDSAEAWRERLAIEWIGQPMPRVDRALPDNRSGRPQPGRRRRDLVRVRSRPGLRLGDERSGEPRAGARLGPPARDHAHRVRELLPPAAAPLGGRGRLHDGRARQRDRQTRGPAHPLPQRRQGDPLHADVRDEGVPAGHPPALRPGPLAHAVPPRAAAASPRSWRSSRTACSDNNWHRAVLATLRARELVRPCKTAWNDWVKRGPAAARARSRRDSRRSMVASAPDAGRPPVTPRVGGSGARKKPAVRLLRDNCEQTLRAPPKRVRRLYAADSPAWR